MSLTGNQKAFARYLADLWGRPEALGEMRGLFPVGDASEAGLLHSFRISKHQSWKPWKGVLPQRFIIGGGSTPFPRTV